MTGEVNRWSPEEAIDRRDRPESTLEADDEREQLMSRMDRLDDRERTILSLRYGLEGALPLTLKEIGRRLGVTREWVREIELPPGRPQAGRPGTPGPQAPRRSARRMGRRAVTPGTRPNAPARACRGLLKPRDSPRIPRAPDLPRPNDPDAAVVPAGGRRRAVGPESSAADLNTAITVQGQCDLSGDRMPQVDLSDRPAVARVRPSGAKARQSGALRARRATERAVLPGQVQPPDDAVLVGPGERASIGENATAAILTPLSIPRPTPTGRGPRAAPWRRCQPRPASVRRG